MIRTKQGRIFMIIYYLLSTSSVLTLYKTQLLGLQKEKSTVAKIIYPLKSSQMCSQEALRHCPS